MLDYLGSHGTDIAQLQVCVHNYMLSVLPYGIWNLEDVILYPSSVTAVIITVDDMLETHRPLICNQMDVRTNENAWTITVILNESDIFLTKS